MQYQLDIPTIMKPAPPSYAEVMAQSQPSAPMRHNTYVHAAGQPTMYDQGYLQMSGYPSSMPAYQHPGNFYSDVSAQPPYNPSYMPAEPSQQSYPTIAPTIVRTETIGPREKNFCERCATCNKKVVIALLITILLLYLIKVLVSRSML